MDERGPKLAVGDWCVTLAQAKEAPIPEGARSALLMQHGSMKLRYYAPQGVDAQNIFLDDFGG